MGLSQRAFAARVGVRQATVSAWERGVHAPTGAAAKALRELAEADEDA